MEVTCALLSNFEAPPSPPAAGRQQQEGFNCLGRCPPTAGPLLAPCWVAAAALGVGMVGSLWRRLRENRTMGDLSGIRDAPWWPFQGGRRHRRRKVASWRLTPPRRTREIWECREQTFQLKSQPRSRLHPGSRSGTTVSVAASPRRHEKPDL